MTYFEFWMLLAAMVSPVTTIVGGLFVIHRSYLQLKSTVATLVTKMDALAPQAQQIAQLTELHTKMQRDIELIKADIRTMREHQQDASRGDPQKGELDELKTAKSD